MNEKYPAISQGYGVFIMPDGGYIFPYKEENGVKSPFPRCESLNVQACAILTYCTGSHTVEEIVCMLEKEFEDTPPDLFSQVKSFLDDVFQKGYITYSDTPVPMKGLLQGNLRHYTPTHVLVETTTKCNLKCGHCLLSAGECLPDELTAAEFIPILENLLEIGVRRLNLSGGEILMKKGWDSLVKFCNNRFSTGMLTNGVLITEKRADALMKVREIHISIYGADVETHERISQKRGSFERALKGIRLLAERGVHVGTSILLVPFNLYQLEDMVNLAISQQCKVVRVGIICPIGRAHDKQWELNELQKEWLDKAMSELKQKYKDQIIIQWEEEESEGEHRCGAGFTRWVITSNGDVYPCGLLRISIGNVARDDPLEICRSPAVRFLQELVAPHGAFCGNCKYLYICKECHGQAFAHCFKVDHCRWAQQFEKAPEPFQSIIWEKYKNRDKKKKIGGFRN